MCARDSALTRSATASLARGGVVVVKALGMDESGGEGAAGPWAVHGGSVTVGAGMLDEHGLDHAWLGPRLLPDHEPDLRREVGEARKCHNGHGGFVVSEVMRVIYLHGVVDHNACSVLLGKAGPRDSQPGRVARGWPLLIGPEARKPSWVAAIRHNVDTRTSRFAPLRRIIIRPPWSLR